VVLTREYLVADLDNQTVLPLVKALARKVGVAIAHSIVILAVS